MKIYFNFIFIIGVLIMFSNKSLNAQMNNGTWEYKLADLKAGMEGLSIAGNPKIVSSPYGDAVHFNGEGDAFFLAANPLNKLTSFTAEVLIKPDLDGPKQQRFIHIGDVDGDRLMIETRITDDGQWYLDTYLQCGKAQMTVVDPKLVHPIGGWYHVALTLDKNGQITNYINGKVEIISHIDFKPINSGETSIGVRRNKVFWYKGSIYKLKISPEVLEPKNFMPF
jgi:hypothetical protein